VNAFILGQQGQTGPSDADSTSDLLATFSIVLAEHNCCESNPKSLFTPRLYLASQQNPTLFSRHVAMIHADCQGTSRRSIYSYIKATMSTPTTWLTVWSLVR